MHGYNAIANLSHAIFLLCCFIMGYFLIKAGGSYEVHAPAGLEERLQKPLHEAGLLVTLSVVILNSLMMLRFVYEKYSLTSLSTAHDRGADLGVPLLPAQHVDSQPVQTERSTCMYNCGCLVAPGRRHNGAPFDTCCKACANVEGSPVAHDPECVVREHDRARW